MKEKLSERVKRIEPSATQSITAKAKELKACGVDVINFGAGEPDFDTPSHIKEFAKKSIDEGFTKYTPVKGIKELLEAICEKFKNDNNIEYSIDEVIVNCGGKHSFFNLMLATINPGDEVIIFSPYWVSYPEIVKFAGGIPVIMELSPDEDFIPDIEKLKALITRKTKFIVINSPANPTGALWGKEILEKILEIALEREVFIVSDEIYEKIIYDGEKHYSIASFSKEAKAITFTLNGVSKTYSMTGWRIGYMGGDKDVISAISKIQGQSTSNPTSLAQKAAYMALTGTQKTVEEMRKAFEERRDYIIEKLNEIEGINCRCPKGSFYAFPDVSNVYKFSGFKKLKKEHTEKPNSIILSEYLLDEAKVCVIPGFAFGADYGIRLSFATSLEDIKEGVKRIKTAIEKLI